MASPIVAFTYFAKLHPGEICGTNGLPLTPNSIVILGRSQFLKSIQHDNLCQYLDIIRSKHERMIIVSEYIGRPLNEHKFANIDNILKVFYQISCGLSHIATLGFSVRTLEPKNILVDPLGNVKLFNYGLSYQTNCGEYVAFPIGNIRYTSPECILDPTKNNILCDIWSLGIIISELFFETTLWPSLNLAQFMRKIFSLINTKNVLEKIARECNAMHRYEKMDANLKALLETCLSISPKDRPSPAKILQHELFQGKINDFEYKKIELFDSMLLHCPLKHVYHWWQLAGGDVHSELKTVGLIRNEAPILSLPKIALLNSLTLGKPQNQCYMYDCRVVMLNLNNLAERLARVKKQDYFPLILNAGYSTNYGIEMVRLPIVIRERDTEYQFHRILLFNRLLKGYPYTRDRIITESQIDIPPQLRGEIWACLLNVIEDNSYESIDKITPTPTDRQIDVDIPRCHQYDELLSSPEGHIKLKRMLKAWVKFHPQYVYWQGLDSLTAPFLYLNFNNEERAFISLCKFIPKYLHWFFLKDNSLIIREYLAKFSQLTAFHEPILANHLREINFIPELFAIPWFLTMFSHVFPLPKIIHLWDKLLLGDNSFPLYIGITILQQLKLTLLDSCFNDCILLFSDLPDIVMETCVVESQKMYLSTPKSISYRNHVLRDVECGKFDLSDIELKVLQSERCPRISANDLVTLLNEQPDCIVSIDLRSHLEYNRAHLKCSINIPFASISIADVRLDALNIPDLETKLANRNVVVLSTSHENAVLFAHFLLDCGTKSVCILHNGFNILHSFVPNVLVTNSSSSFQ